MFNLKLKVSTLYSTKERVRKLEIRYRRKLNKTRKRFISKSCLVPTNSHLQLEQQTFSLFMLQGYKQLEPAIYKQLM